MVLVSKYLINDARFVSLFLYIKLTHSLRYSSNFCLWHVFSTPLYSLQKWLHIMFTSWVRYVAWSLTFGTRTRLKNFVNAVTIGVTHARWVWIFDFPNSKNFLCIWFSSSSQSNPPLGTCCPPFSKWLLLS